MTARNNYFLSSAGGQWKNSFVLFLPIGPCIFFNSTYMNPFGENTHGEVMVFPGGMIAFVDGIPDECEHDWNGDEVFQSASGKMIYWHTYRQWASLCGDARAKLIYEHHEKIDDPIIMGTGSCRKCKKTFHPSLF